MTRNHLHLRSRRLFLTDFGRTATGLLVATSALGACSTAEPTTPDETSADEVSADGTSSAEPSPTGSVPTDAGPTDSLLAPTTPSLVAIDFVAAYVLVRDGEAAVVDTGVADSEGLIEEVLAGLGLGWADVGSIIVTHDHGDHAGSLMAVSELAANARIYGGELDIPGMRSARPIDAVGDGDVVFGLQIIDTPGHTPGHICVYDPAARFLVTGDALFGDEEGATLTRPPAQFTADMGMAVESIAKLATLDVEETLVGHGFPTSGMGSAEIAALAGS